MKTQFQDAPNYLQKITDPLVIRNFCFSGSKRWLYWLWWGLFIGLFCYQLSGIWPLSLFEGDGVSIAVGVNTYATQPFGDHPLSYRYSSQSFTYILIYYVSKILNQSPFQVFSTLSALATIGFILISISIIRRISGYPFALCGLFILSFQEGLTTAYYPNSNSIAAFLVMTGLVLLYNTVHSVPIFPKGSIHPRHRIRCLIDKPLVVSCLSAILISLGMLARLDSIVLLIPFLLVFFFRSKINRYYLVALITFILLNFLWIVFLNVDLPNVLTATNQHLEGSYNWALILKSYLCFFSLFNVWCIGLGVYYLYSHKRIDVLVFALAGVTPIIAIYYRTMTTPKYLFYSLPFWGLLAIYSINGIKKLAPKAIKASIALTVFLVISQYIIGVTITSPIITSSKLPYTPDIPNVFHLEFDQYQCFIDVSIGTGQALFTHDKYRLASGIFYFPAFWHTIKQNHNILIDQMCNQLDLYQDYYITRNGEDIKALIYCSQEKGFLCIRQEDMPGNIICENDHTKIKFTVIP